MNSSYSAADWTLFSFFYQLYRGYVDDFRNTDNAWIETVAMNFHDDTGELLNDIQLKVDISLY